ncbi:internal scaffolding protein [Blackfly microvirus SF02]|uniref:Internal scaffolding protein n=1 Tax=Blackfly microvirus SF02 TaxID=2576452 RepID=A0A4P8PKS0_9VIRU|nr:internal scaffolding protein [Blackfly microvirus SF02]
MGDTGGRSNGQILDRDGQKRGSRHRRRCDAQSNHDDQESAEVNNHARNKKLAIYRNSDPTETDQSQAEETDINVIVRKFAQHGQLPQTGNEPMFGDFSEMPADLREMMETAKQIEELHGLLPAELKGIPMNELLQMTPQQMKDKLTPPAPKQETPKEDKT